MSFEKTAVIGAGTMGNGIAQVMAMSGCSVTLIDVDEAALARGRATIEKSLAKLVSRSSPRMWHWW